MDEDNNMPSTSGCTKHVDKSNSSVPTEEEPCQTRIPPTGISSEDLIKRRVGRVHKFSCYQNLNLPMNEDDQIFQNIKDSWEKAKEAWEEQLDDCDLNDNDTAEERDVRGQVANDSLDVVLHNAKVIEIATNVVAEGIHKLSLKKHLTVKELAAKFENFITQRDNNWSIINFMIPSKTAPGLLLMQSLLKSDLLTQDSSDSCEVAQKKARREKETNVFVIAKSVDELPKQGPDENTEKFKELNTKLHQYCQSREVNSMDYYKLVVDTSFKKTVFNMYATSFLLRDHLAKLDIDANNELVIGPVPADEKEKLNEAEKHQVIVSVDHQSWNKYLDRFQKSNKDKH